MVNPVLKNRVQIQKRVAFLSWANVSALDIDNSKGRSSYNNFQVQTNSKNVLALWPKYLGYKMSFWMTKTPTYFQVVMLQLNNKYLLFKTENCKKKRIRQTTKRIINSGPRNVLFLLQIAEKSAMSQDAATEADPRSQVCLVQVKNNAVGPRVLAMFQGSRPHRAPTRVRLPGSCVLAHYWSMNEYKITVDSVMRHIFCKSACDFILHHSIASEQ